MTESSRLSAVQLDSRLAADLRTALTRYDVIIAVLRYDHGHSGHEQTCNTCARRAEHLNKALGDWDVK
jgi:hypothetical protein